MHAGPEGRLGAHPAPFDGNVHSGSARKRGARTPSRSAPKPEDATPRREFLREGDDLLEAVEELLVDGQLEVPSRLAAQVAQYARRQGWRREPRDLIHAHDVVLAVPYELLRSLAAAGGRTNL